jgi:hypothetical protein
MQAASLLMCILDRIEDRLFDTSRQTEPPSMG